jgi:hypothetical protein
VCKLSITRAVKEKIVCGDCKNYFHWPCVRLSASDVEASGRDWICDLCTKSRGSRKAASHSTPVTPASSVGSGVVASLDMATIERMLSDLRSDIISSLLTGQNKIASDLDNLNKIVSLKSDENIALVEKQNEIISNQQVLLDSLKKENLTLREKVSELTQKLDDSEQYSRRNCVEVFGIPQKNGEDVVKIVQDIGKSLRIDVSPSSIDVCHRLKKRNGLPTPGLIVKFLRTSDALAFLEARRGVRTLSARSLGFQEDNQVYINPSLTENRRRLFGMARVLRRDGKIKHLWVDWAGRVKARKIDGGEVHLLRSESDLKKF